MGKVGKRTGRYLSIAGLSVAGVVFTAEDIWACDVKAIACTHPGIGIAFAIDDAGQYYAENMPSSHRKWWNRLLDWRNWERALTGR